MKLTMTPLQSRLVALLLLVMVLVGVGSLIYVANQRWHQHYDDAISASLDHLSRYQRIIGMKKGLDEGIARVRAGDARRFYLKNSGAALAAAEVQQMGQTVIESHNLKVESTQVVPHKDTDKQRRIIISFRLRGKLEDLQKALYELESAQPLLFVDNLVIRAGMARAYRTTQATPGLEPDVITQLELSAYALTPQAAVQATAKVAK